jgi:hypothetical protein
MRIAGLVLLVAGCGSTSGAASDGGGSDSETPDALGELAVPITCDQHGGRGSGMVVDGTGVPHVFGPSLMGKWYGPASDAPGHIEVDDSASQFVVYGPSCGRPTASCPPPVGHYTTSQGVALSSSNWLLRPVVFVVDIDANTPCFAGRFYARFDSGEIAGWWAAP